MINTILWQIALMLLLVVAGLDAAAWFLLGVVFMFWLSIAIIAKGVSNDEEA